MKVDSEYDKNVAPNYVLPVNYVRYTKKIGDEPDVAFDYCVEDDDLVIYHMIN